MLSVGSWRTSFPWSLDYPKDGEGRFMSQLFLSSPSSPQKLSCIKMGEGPGVRALLRTRPAEGAQTGNQVFALGVVAVQSKCGLMPAPPPQRGDIDNTKVIEGLNPLAGCPT